MEPLSRLARWLGNTPVAQLVLGGVVAMLVAPATPAGAVGWLVACGGLGVGLSWAWSSVPSRWRQPAPDRATWLALGLVGLVGVVTFWPVLAESPSPDWQTGDWGPQHAVLANLIPHLPGLDVPTWNHAVSTGDAPLELYPAMTYLVTGHVAWLLGLEHDLPHAFMIVAALVHLALALTTTAVACRVAPRPIAALVGVFWLVDAGAISHGGTVGLFQWALLHSAFAHAWSMIAALGILAALARPRPGASVAIWIGTAVSTAAHPAALITAAAFAVALAAVAALAADVAPRRALAALGHLALGVALGAVVWLPASDRLLAYGQHYPNELFSAVRVLQLVMAHAMPMTAYSLFVYAGYVGMVLGPWTRRAEVIFVAVIGVVMVLGLCDGPYLALGLAPGKAVARLGAIRMMMLARPFIFAIAAYVIGVVYQHARAAWRTGVSPRQRWAVAALLGITAGALARVVPDYWSAESDRALGEANRFAPDPEGQRQLEAWAAGEVARATPGAWARALVESSTHEHLHLTARTGLPTFHLPPIPDLLLRERIEDTSGASLRRFNVRWVIRQGASPTLGDPATERTFGSYVVREVPGWDGKLARIERGAGRVEVVRIDDDRIEIEVDAAEPVLVALGMGYYPRWRATHASGAAAPVYALPTIEGGKLHVVAAWVAPGRTVFSCDGALPSDGRGALASLLAALAAAGGLVVWSVRSWRWRALRRLARLRGRLRGRGRAALELAAPVAALGLIGVGGALARGPASAVLVGSSAIRPVASVEARLVGADAWQPCAFVPVSGVYRCAELVDVSDATANLLNDAPPSWPFITPVISAVPHGPGVEVRITRRLRLAGRYWLASSPAGGQLEIGRQFRTTPAATPTTLQVPPGEHTVVFTAQLPDSGPLSLAIVEESTLVPDRPFLAGPPAAAPASVTSRR